MSEPEAMTGDGPSAGTLLRQAREAAGLHVDTLAANLKVPVRKLEALEQDRYEELPDAVFVRALASSVCRTLKMDPAPVLQRLPQTPQPRLAQTAEGINAPFHSPKDGPQPGLLHQVSRPVLLTVVALLLGALVLIFLPMAQRGYDTVVEANRPAGDAERTEAAPGETTTIVGPADGSLAGLPAAPASAAGAESTDVAQSPDAGAAAGSAGMQLRTSASTATGAGSPASAAAPAAAASGPIDARGIVVFRARAESWVQVKDASGNTVMQRLLAPGESAGASGALPLSVVVGSAGDTEVQVRGKPFDLARLARDNVARFEVK